MNYLNQNTINCSTNARPVEKTQLNQIKLWCKQYARHNTQANGKQHQKKNAHPSYGHQNSIHQHFNFTHLLPHCKYLYLSERLGNSLPNKSKITYNLINFTLLVLLMQVNNANILNSKGMLYNAITLYRQNTTLQ